MGWLIPMAMAPVSTYINKSFETEGLVTDEKTKAQKRIENFSTLVFTIGGAILTTTAMTYDDTWPTILATVLSSAAVIALEIMRVQFLDRQSLYGLALDGFKKCFAKLKGGENQALLPSNH